MIITADSITHSLGECSNLGDVIQTLYTLGCADAPKSGSSRDTYWAYGQRDFARKMTAHLMRIAGESCNLRRNDKELADFYAKQGLYDGTLPPVGWRLVDVNLDDTSKDLLVWSAEDGWKPHGQKQWGKILTSVLATREPMVPYTTEKPLTNA